MEHVTHNIVYHGDAAACYSWTPTSYVIWTKHLSLHQPWTYLWHLFLDRYHIGRAEDWSAEHQGGCVIVWAFREDCNLASTGFKWHKLYDQTRSSILLCTAVLDGACTGYVKKKVFRCFFKGFLLMPDIFFSFLLLLSLQQANQTATSRAQQLWDRLKFSAGSNSCCTKVKSSSSGWVDTEWTTIRGWVLT